jgi:ubiquinone biosynthesis protein COQ4
MAEATHDQEFEMPAAPPRQPMQWKRGLHYLQRLMDEPDETANAMDLFYALGSTDFERQFARIARSPQGRRLLAERPSLLDHAADREALAAMPDGSLGRAWLAYLDRFGFDPNALIEIQRAVRARWEREEGAPEMDEIRAWYQERNLMLHDAFHVLTGYDADPLGEATLLAFTQGQLGGRVNRLLTLGATLRVAPRIGWRWIGFVFRAWQRGRRAVFLHAVSIEELLPLPLDEVRTRLRIDSPEKAHPRGLLCELERDDGSPQAA